MIVILCHTKELMMDELMFEIFGFSILNISGKEDILCLHSTRELVKLDDK